MKCSTPVLHGAAPEEAWRQNAGVQILAVPSSYDIHTSHLNFLSFPSYKIGQASTYPTGLLRELSEFNL